MTFAPSSPMELSFKKSLCESGVHYVCKAILLAAFKLLSVLFVFIASPSVCAPSSPIVLFLI